MATALGDLGYQRPRDRDDAIDVGDDEVARQDIHTAYPRLDVDARTTARPNVSSGDMSAGERREAQRLDLRCVTNEPVDDNAGGSAADRGTREQFTP